MSAHLLRDAIVYSKYANELKKAKRRENWAEAVERTMNMHRKKLKKQYTPVVMELINKISEAVCKLEVLPSMRSLQFGGDAILKKHAKMYNCSATYVDRPRVFLEAFWMLLCGCGTGFSVQEHHVRKLPKISKPLGTKVVWIVEDSIEGWAYALGALLASYGMVGQSRILDLDDALLALPGHHVEFDYSKIRPQGSALSSGNGLAPGPEPLAKALETIRRLLDALPDNHQLRPYQATDILLIASDAVMSGGVRRSASIALFSAWDDEMLDYKVGNWYETHPWRGRANVTVLLLRNADEVHFEKVKCRAEQWGEPGIMWANTREALTNPCIPGDVRLCTPSGWKRMRDISVGDQVWGPTGWTNVIRKMNNGVKEVFNYQTKFGSFRATQNHRIVSGEGIKQEVYLAPDIELLTMNDEMELDIKQQDVVDGLVFGDGYWHKASRAPFLCVGADDMDYFKSIDNHIGNKMGGTTHTFHVKTTLTQEELVRLPIRTVPERFRDGDLSKVAGFLRGLYSANGSVLTKHRRITLKGTCLEGIRQVQVMLSLLDIKSYITSNKERDVTFKNGTYSCKESYDLNITSDRGKFAERVGFVQGYKQDKLSQACTGKVVRKRKTEIFGSVSIGEMEVYDITVDNDSHSYMIEGGYHVSNCGEIGLYAHHPTTGESGWQVCNLTTINLTSCVDVEDFNRRCYLASALGTIQASYTSFPFLGKVTEEIIRNEALIGVSMTGIYDNLKLVNDPSTLRNGSLIVKQTNEAIASLLGINAAARCTTIKPEGTASLVCMSSSGIHPRHSAEYLRRVQYSATEPMTQILLRDAPELLEAVYRPDYKNPDDPNRYFSGYCAVFHVEAPDPTATEKTVTGLEMLETVKLFKKYWVDTGTNEHLCVSKTVKHNVSNTLKLADDEIDTVFDEIRTHKDLLNGISFLRKSGDIDWIAPPHVDMYPVDQVLPEVQEAFDLNNFWLTEREISDKTGVDVLSLRKQYNKLWAERCKAFSGTITWSTEGDGVTNHNQTVACAGGVCELV